MHGIRQPAIRYDGPTSTFVGWTPVAPLADCVELIWMTSGRDTAVRERVLPNGVVEVIVNLGGPQRVEAPEDATRFTRYRDAWIAGLQRTFIVISAETDSQLVGIRFKPGGAWPFLGVPLGAVTDAVVELDELLRPFARAPREPLLEAGTAAERLAIVEAVLLARRGERRRDPRVGRALALLRDDGRRVADVAADLGITHKHLISLFEREVGLSPKALARVLRFAGVVRALASATKVRWTDVAHAHGYADQSHLVGEFRAFTGVTPTAYLRARSVDPNHLVLE